MNSAQFSRDYFGLSFAPANAQISDFKIKFAIQAYENSDVRILVPTYTSSCYKTSSSQFKTEIEYEVETTIFPGSQLFVKATYAG